LASLRLCAKPNHAPHFTFANVGVFTNIVPRTHAAGENTNGGEIMQQSDGPRLTAVNDDVA